MEVSSHLNSEKFELEEMDFKSSKDDFSSSYPGLKHDESYALDCNENNVINKCDMCPREAKFKCSRCEDSWSCSLDHGSFHELHGACAPFQINSDSNVGRFLTAKRDIRAGEIICCEEPLIVGPNQETNPICLGCLAEIDTSYVCSGCGYPMCDEECSSSAYHTQECLILSRAIKPTFTDSFNSTEYHCILPLRLLLVENPRVSDLLHQFKDHRVERYNNEYWRTAEQHVVKFIRERCSTDIPQEDIQHAVGLLEINCFELRSYGDAGYRGIFAIGSLASHSCSSNAKMIFGKEPPFLSKLVATQDIPKGVEITTSYLDPLLCTLKRKQLLSVGW
ncbi:protein msta [Eurytemora carolleeae]|uniref:protein msta n=1 Tax=Eurytemora carolleeae TaxID=1294199 RepID=UPI000C787513|nr:protein msta [Eurytemora carolleeae]|eukprot:XP_023331827.1 protein msta-like [Eurytemora affinis]